MSERPPDDIDFKWLIENFDQVRDNMRFIEQLKRLEVVTITGKRRSLLYSNKSGNAVLDLRETETAAAPLPIDPPELVITVNDDNDTLDLSWTLPNAFDELFLERGLDGENFEPLATLAGTDQSYVDSSVEIGVEYFYRIRGSSAAVVSAWSNVVSGQLAPEVVDPPVLSIDENDEDGTLDLSWVNGEEDYDALYLERSLDGEMWDPLETLAGDATSYLDDDVDLDTEYFYRIRGERDSVLSEWSNEVSGELSTVVGLALFGAGDNASNQLGDGTTTPPDELTSITTPASFVKVAGGATHSIAIDADGKLYSCGVNTYGQCGDGSSGNTISTWTQVGTDTDWADVSAGSHFSMATKADGSVHVFGRNNLGQLGLGDNTNRLSPTQVGSGSTWIWALASEFNILMVRDDNTLWMAGWGTQNQIGDGGASNRNALTQTTGSGFVRAYAGRDFAFGIKTDGTLHSWGSNSYGQLGLNSVTSNFSSPQAVGSDTDWKGVSGGESFAIATKTDGTVYVAGEELSGGELGLGAATDTGKVFVQIIALASCDYTSSGPSSTLAIKTTGEVYGWGYNGDGNLGVGDTTDRDTPTRESTSSTWAVVAHACAFHALALR